MLQVLCIEALCRLSWCQCVAVLQVLCIGLVVSQLVSVSGCVTGVVYRPCVASVGVSVWLSYRCCV